MRCKIIYFEFTGTCSVCHCYAVENLVFKRGWLGLINQSSSHIKKKIGKKKL
jgi:hypothetical protein